MFIDTAWCHNEHYVHKAKKQGRGKLSSKFVRTLISWNNNECILWNWSVICSPSSIKSFAEGKKWSIFKFGIQKALDVPRSFKKFFIKPFMELLFVVLLSSRVKGFSGEYVSLLKDHLSFTYHFITQYANVKPLSSSFFKVISQIVFWACVDNILWLLVYSHNLRKLYLLVGDDKVIQKENLVNLNLQNSRWMLILGYV